MARPARLAVVGDVHLAFGSEDVRALDREGYDAVLFVGDLAGYRPGGGLEVARHIAQLRTPAYVIPGNHDGVHPAQLVAEVLESDAAARLLDRGPLLLRQEARLAALAEALRGDGGAALLGGYARHRLEGAHAPIDLVLARPCSFGGPRLSFRPYLERAFGITSLASSAARLTELLLACDAAHLVVLAHNGPAGLGARRHDMFGCDFRREEGDFGDPDLRDAIEAARARGRTVTAVVAGHMHHAVRGGGRRPMAREVDGTLYVNAARVPRVFREGGRELRHHVRLEIDRGRARAEEVLASSAPDASLDGGG
jgi:uncharacterized protein (TIGR04168 family)